MRFKIPGQDVSARIFERVSTTDSQYDIFDVGLEQADGSIDSIVVGGSFSLIKSFAADAENKKAKKDAKKARKAAKKQVEAAIEDVVSQEPSVPVAA